MTGFIYYNQLKNGIKIIPCNENYFNDILKRIEKLKEVKK